jgi:signal transduction histidine kinase
LLLSVALDQLRAIFTVLRDSRSYLSRRKMKVEDDRLLRDIDSGWSQKRLPQFIAENIGPIVGEWEDFARTLTPHATNMTSLALRDHSHQILAYIVSDMKSAQTPKEETIKSHGLKSRSPAATAAETHAAIRLTGGFDIGQMTSEYRALRASVIKLWRRKCRSFDDEDIADLTRFNESIDQELKESVSYYTAEVIFSKDLFASILGHDLRSPTQAILLSSELMLHLGTLNERQRMLTKNIFEGSQRMGALIDTLLDVTRARFGAGLSIFRVPMDMGFVAHQIVDELRVIHPSRSIILSVSENVRGEWDKTRVGQIFSNLIGNAIQYGFKDLPVEVDIRDNAEDVTLTVKNKGVPIAPDKLGAIFNPLTRGRSDDKADVGSMNLGLGLFIVNEVVQAHGGSIQVTSSEENGTSFNVELPRLKTGPALRIVEAN